MSRFDFEEELFLSYNLEDKHALFNKFWSMVRPVFSKEIPTAAVGFDKLGDCIQFKINPDFWSTLNLNQKLFVVCHECLHVLLSHGFRAKEISKEYRKIANVAMDLVVNQTLVDRFGFDRATVEPKELKYCWLDTVLPEPLPADKSFEFYFNAIRQKVEEQQQSDSFDDHGELESFDSKEFADRLTRELQECNPEEIKDMKQFLENKAEGPAGKAPANGQQAGTSQGNVLKTIVLKKVSAKKKWESIIKNWTKRALTFFETEQWAQKSRRMSNVHTDFMLPSDMETEDNEKSKIEVWFFQDTSGSCAHLAERFFKAAATIPPEKFNVRMFCFDTQVYPTTLKSGKLYGFGGTTFTCIEEYIQQACAKDNLAYPAAVFCITDGYGDVVKPAKPKNWYWFLSMDYKECIPKECKTFKLDDFE
jgi:predicted metal-dependent peptidase